MSAIALFERVEPPVQAVKITEGDEDNNAIARGWMGAPIDADLSEYYDVWVVKRRSSGQAYLVPNDVFIVEFRQIANPTDEEVSNGS